MRRASFPALNLVRTDFFKRYLSRTTALNLRLDGGIQNIPLYALGNYIEHRLGKSSP